MKRSPEALVFLPMVLVVAAMAIVGLCGIARAEPVQQFTFQVHSPRAGDLTAYMHLRRFDTTGLVPPTPTEFTMRLPRGVEINRTFLTSRYLCDGPALRDALDAHISAVPFPRRLERLGAFARTLERSGTKRDLAALPNVRACARGRLGGGSGLIDARDAIAVLTDPIPFHFSIFLSRGVTPNALAGFTVVGSADERSAIVRKYPVVAGVHAAVTESLFFDPTPDGRFGLKLAINTGPISGFQVSIAEIEVTVRPLQLRRGTCLARGRGSRCTRRQRTDESLFAVPRCPASGHFSAQLDTVYPPPTPRSTTTVEVPCPRYTA
ncbi:MAG TPA: hypothetical protein VKB03_00665 [Conexibacter sp.]|nr:hypothetical protein [Conexibacter sp.]